MCNIRFTLPLLLLHRLPSFKFSYFPFLRTKYTVLDQHADPPDPSFTALSKSARSTPLTSDDLDRYPAVECVVGSITGLNHIDLAACRRRDIRVTSVDDAFSDDVADYAIGLAIDVLRGVSTADRFVRAGSSTFEKEYILGSKSRNQGLVPVLCPVNCRSGSDPNYIFFQKILFVN
ncbi:hypothetical protein Pfo_025485 [Paulownia fortunei]|nr:hypothetical protein Pfo_025485 [Paulownia fortunei]